MLAAPTYRKGNNSKSAPASDEFQLFRMCFRGRCKSHFNLQFSSGKTSPIKRVAIQIEAQFEFHTKAIGTLFQPGINRPFVSF